MTRKVTLRQVADKAGVAIGTASAVFADKSWVSDRVRLAVQQAADELGYAPRQKRPEPVPVTDIAFISWAGEAFSPANPYFAAVLHGAQQACADLGISLHYEVADPARGGLPQSLERGQVSGLLLLSYASDHDYLQRIVDQRVPCVLLEHEPVDLPVDHVRHDDELGGYLAGKHLLSLSERPRMPGVITAEDNITPARHRLAGFRRALDEAGVAFDDRYLCRGTFDVASGLRCMNHLLDLDVPPAAVFCANDESALGALEAARARGLAVPADIAVMGYDDVPQAARAEPPLTTIATDKHLIGAQAVRHLLDRVGNPAMTSRDTRLAVRLVQRDSTAR
ncbi:LacI family DNA-binding transcriptional regulator [Streptomyces sp. NPDC001046]|uniref:LacI family DNA-binding transcriptional regulator n=1 Tax=unclassified Streptomyces TaxID=2593676 RepID=UPI0035D6CDEC